MKAHVQKVVGSNPAVYWMDVSGASYYVHENNKKIKVAEWGTSKKYLTNKKSLNVCLGSQSGSSFDSRGYNRYV
jgi:hypothetical protein